MFALAAAIIAIIAGFVAVFAVSLLLGTRRIALVRKSQFVFIVSGFTFVSMAIVAAIAHFIF